MEATTADFGGWRDCLRISNGEVELIVGQEIGPRILRYGFTGGPNLLHENRSQQGRSGEDTWQARGGHRLWIAPETPETYALDNSAVEVSVDGNAIRASGPVEPETGLRKVIEVRLAEAGTRADVRHELWNQGSETKTIAPWAITALAPGGVAFARFPVRGTFPHSLQPTHPLVMWAYTDFSDPRWSFTRQFLILRQGPGNSQKAGLYCEDMLLGYLLGDTLFLKRAEAQPAASYCDFGCSLEMYTDGDMLELETLGPVTALEPGACVTHQEQWSLHPRFEITEWTDEGIRGALQGIE